jgi:tetratricopeptide (TPR) repeat protein
VSYAAAEQHLRRAVQLHRATGAGDDALRAELHAIFRLMEVTNATRNAAGADVTVLQRGQELADRLGDDDIGLKLFYFDGAAVVSGARMEEVEPRSIAYRDRTQDDPRPEVRASGLMAYGIACWSQGRIAEAIERLGEALPLFGDTVPEDAFVAEQMLMAVVFDLVSQAMAGTRDEEETFATFGFLADTVPPIAVPPVCAIAIDVALLLDRPDVVTLYDQRVRTIDPSSEFAFWGGQLLVHRGLELIRTGDVDGGLAAFDQGRDRYLAAGGRSGMALFLAERAVAVLAHRPDLAADMLAEAWAEHRSCGEGWSEPHLHTAAARVAAAGGDLERAAEHLERAIVVAEEQGSVAIVGRTRALADRLGITA